MQHKHTSPKSPKKNSLISPNHTWLRALIKPPSESQQVDKPLTTSQVSLLAGLRALVSQTPQAAAIQPDSKLFAANCFGSKHGRRCLLPRLPLHTAKGTWHLVPSHVQSGYSNVHERRGKRAKEEEKGQGELFSFHLLTLAPFFK